MDVEAARAPADDAAIRPLAEISSGVARVLRQRLGRGPRKCRANWAGPDALLLLLENGYTDAERTLRDAGRLEEVAAGRRALHTVLEPEMRAVVGEATGREVVAMLTASRFDPDLSAEVFVLGPSDGSGAEPEAFAGARAAIQRSTAGKEASARSRPRAARRSATARSAARTAPPGVRPSPSRAPRPGR